MLPEQAEQMLTEYKASVGRCNYLKCAIQEAEKELSYWKAKQYEDAISTGTAILDGMPHGTNISRPTERIALILAMGYEPEHISEAEERLAELREELRRKEMVVMFVSAWLEGLSEKERWLIEQVYFENATYNDTARAYTERYNEPMSREGIRRLKKATTDKIAEMAQ